MSNLQDQIIEQAGQEMAREIDREILWGMLIGMGWTRVMIDPFRDNEHAVDITWWLEANCEAAYERHGRDFIFESEKDAVNFILKWK